MWRKDGDSGTQLNGLKGHLQPNAPKQTDCQKRTGLRQTEGQINRHTDSAKANKRRQCCRQTDGQTQQGDRRLVRQDGSAIHLLSESSCSVCSVSWSVFNMYTVYSLTRLSLSLPSFSFHHLSVSLLSLCVFSFPQIIQFAALMLMPYLPYIPF